MAPDELYRIVDSDAAYRRISAIVIGAQEGRWVARFGYAGMGRELPRRSPGVGGGTQAATDEENGS